MNIGKLDMIYHSVIRWVDGEGSLIAVASHLDMSYSTLEELFLLNGIINASGDPGVGVTVQEVLSCITLYYAMKPTTEFSKTVIR